VSPAAVYQGLAVSEGVATGQVYPGSTRRGTRSATPDEVGEAFAAVAAERSALARQLRGDGRGEQADIVEIGALIAADPALVDPAVAAARDGGEATAAAEQSAATQAAALASLANAKIRGLALYRSLLLWPYGIAPAIAGIIWLFIFHPSYGVLPYVLSFVTAYQFNWFLKGWVAMTLIVVAAIWKQFGYNLAFYLAGLQAIPGELYEAAEIDGADVFGRFRNITLPGLANVMVITALLSTIWTATSINFVYVLTNGGPAGATMTFPMLAYQVGVAGAQRLGMGATISLVFFPIFLVMIFFLTRRMLRAER